MAATDYQSLLSSANVACYANQPVGIQRVLELALLQIIANNISGSGGNSSGIQGGSGNYGGGQPTFTPAAGNLGVAVDTSNGQLWLYYSGGWH